MAKQSKITVKHYLEKKVKPIFFEEEKIEAYPLYYRITYKTKTTNLRSFTGAVMTETTYENFKKTNNCEGFDIDYNPKYIYKLKLDNELLFIEKAIEYITNNNDNINVFDKDFTEKIKCFFVDLKNSLYYQGWYKHKQQISLIEPTETKEDIEFENQYKEKYFFLKVDFFEIFNKKKSLNESLDVLKKVTGFDATRFIHKNTLKFWHVIDLILFVYRDTLFIDFFVNYDVNKIIKTNKDNNFVSSEEIILICNRLKNSYLKLYLDKKE